MTPQTSVLVICEHELLGEGLAARLQAMGIHATTARSRDTDAMAAALRSHPEVVVVETTDDECRVRVEQLSPTSRVVDVTASIGRGYPTEAMRFDVILDALRPEPPVQTPV
jgi:DNA-binding NarL/FixJ family response regulator